MQDVLSNPVTGETITFLKTAKSTDGAHTQFTVQVPQGGGPVPHAHDAYDEHITCLEGILSIVIDGKKRLLEPGEDVLIKTGQVHQFYNEQEGDALFRVDVKPAHAGYEAMLRLSHGFARDGRSNASGLPKDPRGLALMATYGNTKGIGLLRLANPLFAFLGFLARITGYEAKVRARYLDRVTS